MKKTELINQLTEEEKKKLLAHFNTIYECKQLNEHEYNIIYLAWMWANGHIVDTGTGSTFDESKVDAVHEDYEVSFESDTSGGMNLDLFYEFYELDKIMELMGWNENRG